MGMINVRGIGMMLVSKKEEAEHNRRVMRGQLATIYRDLDGLSKEEALSKAYDEEVITNRKLKKIHRDAMDRYKDADCK